MNIQRLLDEGLFVASYKFALLLALADLSVESGDDSGVPLTLTVEQIAEKFIQYYWRQATPYTTPAQARILQQNTGKQAAILNALRDSRRAHGGSVATVMKQREWKALVRDVATAGPVMPLWNLQTIGRERLGPTTIFPMDSAFIFCLPHSGR